MLVNGHYVEVFKENRQKSLGRGKSVGHCNKRYYRLAPKKYVKPKVINIELFNMLLCLNVHIL